MNEHLIKYNARKYCSSASSSTCWNISLHFLKIGSCQSDIKSVCSLSRQIDWKVEYEYNVRCQRTKTPIHLLATLEVTP